MSDTKALVSTLNTAINLMTALTDLRSRGLTGQQAIHRAYRVNPELWAWVVAELEEAERLRLLAELRGTR